jgi:hypothetical protein
MPLVYLGAGPAWPCQEVGPALFERTGRPHYLNRCDALSKCSVRGIVRGGDTGGDEGAAAPGKKKINK